MSSRHAKWKTPAENVHMTSSVYFTHAEKTTPSDQSVLLILKASQAQHKVKNHYSLYRYKR